MTVMLICWSMLGIKYNKNCLTSKELIKLRLF